MERDTRERILSSAEEVLAQQGFGGARIREIARRAGVTSAMVHYYFRTKEDMYRAVLDRLIAEMVDLAQRIAPEPIDPVDKLQRFFYGFFDFAARHRSIARLTSMETGHADQMYFLGLVDKHLRPLYLEARAFIERGIATGVFRPVDPEHLLTVIYGMIVSYFSDSPFLQVLLGSETTEAARLARRRDELMSMILRVVLADPAVPRTSKI